MNPIKVYGTQWCGSVKRALKILDENASDYELIDIDRDEAAAAFVMKINHGNRSVPTLLFPDGSTLTEPTSAELINKIQSMPK